MRERSEYRLVAASLICTAIVAGVAVAAEAPLLLVPVSKVTLHVAVDLPGQMKPPAAEGFQLVEVDKAEVKLPAQLVPAIAADGAAGEKAGRLVADIPPRDGASDPRRFRLEGASNAAGASGGFEFKEIDDKSLKLAEGPSPVLVYNHGTITCERVPKTDARRSRACYIHPVWASAARC